MTSWEENLFYPDKPTIIAFSSSMARPERKGLYSINQIRGFISIFVGAGVLERGEFAKLRRAVINPEAITIPIWETLNRSVWNCLALLGGGGGGRGIHAFTWKRFHKVQILLQ